MCSMCHVVPHVECDSVFHVSCVPHVMCDSVFHVSWVSYVMCDNVFHVSCVPHVMCDSVFHVSPWCLSVYCCSLLSGAGAARQPGRSAGRPVVPGSVRGQHSVTLSPPSCHESVSRPLSLAM